VADDFNADAYYTAEYFDGGHADGYADYQGSALILRREFSKVVQRLQEMLPKGGRLLEIGCAYGFFLEEARKHFSVCGIEISQAAVDFCHESGLSEVECGPAKSETIRRLGPYNAIVMLDVIEHLPDPSSTLTECAGMLAPGGVLILTTGDFGSAFARLSGQSWRLMTPPQHLWFFTQRSMERIAQRLGLEIVQIEWPWKIVPLSLIRFQLGRAIGLKNRTSTGSGASRLGVPVNLFDAMRIVLRRPVT
jgi:SAM-dependent methyltransferase